MEEDDDESDESEEEAPRGKKKAGPAARKRMQEWRWQYDHITKLDRQNVACFGLASLTDRDKYSDVCLGMGTCSG
jgi:hypothetical protein